MDFEVHSVDVSGRPGKPSPPIQRMEDAVRAADKVLTATNIQCVYIVVLTKDDQGYPERVKVRGREKGQQRWSAHSDGQQRVKKLIAKRDAAQAELDEWTQVINI